MANDKVDYCQPPGTAVSSGDAPWASAHRAALARRAGTTPEGGCLTALPSGHLVAWDLNGFTGRLRSMPEFEQVDFLRRILNAAVKMAKDLGLVMLAAPAGDQGLYYAPPSVSVAAVMHYLDTSLDLGSVKAVVLPAPEQALLVATLFDATRARGFHGVTGSAYAQALQGLSEVRRPMVLPVRQHAVVGHFPLYDPRDPRPVLTPQDEALLSMITRPKIPEGPHYYGIIGLSKGLDLARPTAALELARELFTRCPDVNVHRLDEGKPHFTVTGESSLQVLEGLVRVCRSFGLSVHAKKVQRASVLEAYGMRDVVGGAPVELVNAYGKRGRQRRGSVLPARHIRGQIDAAHGVAPFVVVPG